MAMMGIVVLPGTGAAKSLARRYFRLAPLMLLLFVLSSCGGGSSSLGGATGGGQSNPNGTPSGMYTLTVNAKSDATAQTTLLTLIVQ